MCLWINKKATEQFRQKIVDNGGKITVFKRYSLELTKEGGFEVMSPMQGRLAVIDEQNFVWSNRRSAKLTKHESISLRVERGIHTYVSKSDHLDVIPVEGYLDDFVAASGREVNREIRSPNAPFQFVRYESKMTLSEAVFLKVKFTDESFKALDQLAKRECTHRVRDAKQSVKNYDREIKQAQKIVDYYTKLRDKEQQIADTSSRQPRFEFRER